MYITELPYGLDDDFYLKDLIEDIVFQLVDDTDTAGVSEISEDSKQCILQITVDSKEVGKVIGKNRAIIQSLWNLVVAITRGRKKVVIQILDQSGDIQYPIDQQKKSNGMKASRWGQSQERAGD